MSFSSTNHMKYAHIQPAGTASSTNSSHNMNPPYEPNIQSMPTAKGRPKESAATFMKFGLCCKYLANLTRELVCIRNLAMF
jgi:hypothetical protein